MDPVSKNVFTAVEQGFNIAGSLPVVSFFSGVLRVLVGKIQCVAGLSMALAGGIGQLASKDKKWEKLTQLGLEHTLHGALNAIRGAGEAILCAATGGIGNLFLLIPNLMQKPPFSPYVQYGILTDPAHRPSLV